VRRCCVWAERKCHGRSRCKAIAEPAPCGRKTLCRIEYAIAAGVDTLELDLGVTRDNVVVVSHDPYLEPPVCFGPQPKAAIRELTLAEVRRWDCGAKQNPGFPASRLYLGHGSPTLDEVFALAPKGKFEFNIETKIFAEKPELAPSPEEFARLFWRRSANTSGIARDFAVI